MTRKAPPLIVSILLPGADGALLTAFHDPGDTPVIPRIGERVRVEDDWFTVIDVAYSTRTAGGHWREGRMYPGDNPGWGDAIGIQPGVIEVEIFVKRSDGPDRLGDDKGNQA